MWRLYMNVVYFQLEVLAYDPQYPVDFATATVTLSISRNENVPIFSPPTYRVTISETAIIGSSVIRVTASDNDGVCIRL